MFSDDLYIWMQRINSFYLYRVNLCNDFSAYCIVMLLNRVSKHGVSIRFVL
ncbi:hypothetical protein HMPREF3156_00437 [Neisseria sp. HMSC06F02]|nr:hypothetical protein HMPREF3156_00437 [Neisseria sp. HMSC06F02]